MNLSRNFTLQELIKSDTAIRLDINNNPNSGQIEKLKDLCKIFSQSNLNFSICPEFGLLLISKRIAVSDLINS